jgi:trigger factor
MTTITETGPFERLVSFKLTDEQINDGKAATARKLAQEIKIAGFRPGKAPVPVIEATVGAERLRSEVIDDILPPVLTDVLNSEEIRPAVTPQLESMNDVDGGVEVEVRVTLWPTIELPEYKDRSVEVTSPEVTDEDLETQVVRMLEQFGTVEEVERPAAAGDFVSVDVSASDEGADVEEATASDLLYEVGSGLFIDGLDEHVEGASAGDVLEFESPLPSGFGDRAGEPVTFKVVVNEVKERILPELDDGWVEENTEFDTVEELKAELRERLSEAKLEAVSRQFTERALSTLVDQVEVDLPEALIRAEMDDLLHRFAHRLEDSQLTLEDYFNATGIDQDAFIEDIRNQASRSLRNQLVLEAVARAEEIDVTEEDLSNTLQALAAQSGDPVAYLRAFRESGRELALASDIVRNRALDAILSGANPVDEDGEPIDLRLQMSEVEAEVVEALPDDGDDKAPVVEAEIVAAGPEEEE